MEEAVRFESDGLTLYGILGRPERAAAGGVVFIHGWSGYRIGPHNMLVHAARRFNREGFATLRFDLRGRGDSEGEAARTNLDDMIADTCAAVRFFRERTGVPEAALLGICSGANVAIGAATLMPEVRSLILWSVFAFAPQRSKMDDIRRTGSAAGTYAAKLFQLETWKKFFRGRVHFALVRRALFGGGESKTEEGRNLKDSRRDIMAAWAEHKGRALFIHGSQDAESVGARELYRGFCEQNEIDAEFHLIQGANHSFYSLEWEREVIDRSVRWLA